MHEALSAILAFRISQIQPMSFSISMNDYGFELLSDIPIPIDDSNVYELLKQQKPANRYTAKRQQHGDGQKENSGILR